MAAIEHDSDEVVTYPGKMITYPGFTRGQPPLYVHDCVQVSLVDRNIKPVLYFHPKLIYEFKPSLPP